MAMDFPNSPTVGQTFSQGSRTWVWTGTTWDSPTADTNGVVGSAGGTFTGDITAPNYAGRGNAIINGAFDIWQRGTSGSASSGNYGYGPDRFAIFSHSGTSGSWSQQTFTPGTAPVAGYEGQYFARFTSTNTSTIFRQPIEDVRTFAGQQVTLSFWMKAASAITLNSRYTQEFGSGGSSAVDTGSTSHSITNSWARYTANVTLPSVVGKTIGAGSSLRVIFDSSSINVAVDIWGVQLEAGSVATPFKRNAPSIQAELAACQRYYWRQTCISSYERVSQFGRASSSTVLRLNVQHPVTMRTAPSSIDYANLVVTDGAGTIANVSSIASNIGSPFTHSIDVTASGMTSSQMYALLGNPANTSWLGFNAEL
jgi:hypothetical protein